MSDAIDAAERAVAAGLAAVDTPEMGFQVTKGNIREREVRAILQAAADTYLMPYTLGDEGWETLARKSEEAGYDRRLTDRRRQRDDFTTCTIEAAYQYGYRETLRRLGSKEWRNR